MAKLRITLKQHTPLIHFQSEQEGATIRATEFKPKLDKFLIEHAFEGNQEEKFEQYKQYLIGYNDKKTKEDFKDKEAFDYKVRFLNVKGEELPCEIEYVKYNSTRKNDFPLYFGNMGKNKKETLAKKSKFILFDTIDVEFFSLKEFLIKKIIQFLPLFLMKHNFGQRQSKGFGSLYINDSDEYHINGVKKNYSKQYIHDNKKLKYSFDIEIKNSNIIEKSFQYKEYWSAFSIIQKLYNSFRAGDRNIDSYIKKYAFKNKMTWDKDIIKKQYDNANLIIEYGGYLIKDLLGLSVEENWLKQGFKITKLHKNEKIERFQSPIFFKPIRVSKNNFIVYFEGREIPEKFLNETFKIKKDEKGDLELKTPEIFNIDDFIEYVIKENKNKNIELKLTEK